MTKAVFDLVYTCLTFRIRQRPGVSHIVVYNGDTYGGTNGGTFFRHNYERVASSQVEKERIGKTLIKVLKKAVQNISQTDTLYG